MSEKTKFINARRRGFLQGTVVAGGAVATGVASAHHNGQHPEAESTTVDTSKHAGYQLTDKVREYYRKARF